ncbi:Vms1/Ankzf1 family peptidyl-tRNA hydrolase [Halobaculum lipolyticum]|uniref:Vms1/Ankzf1 family peptidyl-tRNA hydrolase n=1 Tax=Halobaculum lipolyticum TaxID=3032001 RepID=A0ABD5WB20_9EURY|nr:Vms1/Ankzf1 family peptidyl-tRNA hydrolase [Halobaculum sp. DT31]
MLDRLLGRAHLKERIAELEAERDDAVARMEAEEERRGEAARKRQAAEKRVNELETRITELENRLGRAEATGEATVEFRGMETLRPKRRDEVLARLRSVETGREGALSAFVADDGDVPEPVRDALGDRAPLVRRAAPTLVYRDDAGLVSCALEPALDPAPFEEWADSFRVEASWFRPTGRFAFGLVRSDTFAVGVYEDDERVSLETVRTDVMDEHDKGGFSQARYERLREEQIDEHLDDCREVLEELPTDLDRVVLVGERGVVKRVAAFADHTAGSDATGKPVRALDDAFDDFWTAKLRLL